MEYNLSFEEATEKMKNGAVVTNSLRGDNCEWLKIHGKLCNRSKGTIGPYFNNTGTNHDFTEKVKWKVVKEKDDHVYSTGMTGTGWLENNRNCKLRKAEEILDTDGNFILYSNL